jgi:hypothetical protein
MTIHHLDQVVRLPVKTLDQIARENEGLPDLYECLAMRHSPPLCDAPHSTSFAVFALRVAAAIAVTYVLLVGALLVTPA